MTQQVSVFNQSQEVFPERYQQVMSERMFVSKPNQGPSPVRYFGIMEEPAASFNRRIHMPDSHPGVLINLGSPFMVTTADGQRIELPRVFFGGIQNSLLRVQATGTCRYIGLDMHAWGTRFFIGAQANLAGTAIVPLGGVWDDLAQTLEATFQRQNEDAALTLLDQFVTELHQRSQFDVTTVRTALDALYATDGRFNLHELAARCYLSPSQLERQFKYYIGVTPKTFARAVRLDAILVALSDTPARQMTHLAQRFGFTDQSHFIHDFRSLMGCTPTEFIASRSA